MKIKKCVFWRAAALIVLMVSASHSFADSIDFDELSLAPDSFFDGYGSDASGQPWSSGGATFNTGAFTGGWSYSNQDDTSTAGFTNQWAAFTGEDFSGTGNYALAFSFEPNSAFINLPTGQWADSIRVTNTTYAAISMRDGDGFAKEFGGDLGDDPDFFRVIFNGFRGNNGTGDQVGRVEFYLADYRFDDNGLDYIVDGWEELSLASLSGARSIGIEFESSDVGQFGINTPTYVAVDNLLTSSVPEPTSFAALLGLGLVGLRRRSRVK